MPRGVSGNGVEAVTPSVSREAASSKRIPAAAVNKRRCESKGKAPRPALHFGLGSVDERDWQRREREKKRDISVVIVVELLFQGFSPVGTGGTMADFCSFTAAYRCYLHRSSSSAYIYRIVW